MKKFILGGVAATAIALGGAGAANAATTCQTVPTTTGQATFHATQPSGGGGNWDHTFSVNVATDGGWRMPWCASRATTASSRRKRSATLPARRS